MNFVRYVKTPRITVTQNKKSKSKGNVKKTSTQQLSLILTITADFSPFAGATNLLCQLVSSNGSILGTHQIQWVGHERDIKVDFAAPSALSNYKVVITPIGASRPTNFLCQFLGGNVSHVVGVETQTFSTNETATRQDTVNRRFKSPACPIVIAEQAGETIIRHVWDAGIIFSAIASYHYLETLPRQLKRFIQPLSDALRPVTVLELGTGVGVLGICIAQAFPNSKVVMTDLLDAQPLVDENIHLNTSHCLKLAQNFSFRVLDWEEQPYPKWTTTEKYDLIVMADVTYNIATFVALANTLEHLLRTGSRGARVLCCGKRRHDEEEQFWSIVRERGFVIEQRDVFSMDLEGNFEPREDGRKGYGEQLVDFIGMTLPDTI